MCKIFERRKGIGTETIWFQKYRILRELGQGFSSQVFLAEHIKLRCSRAIKRISKENPCYPQLINEAKILKNLKHPNIPIIYDIEEDENYFYIIEEYIMGQSLKAYRLTYGTIKENVIIDFAIQISDLLQYLHMKKDSVLYLDLKPDNILIYENTLKLIDFGAAVYEKEACCRKYSLGTKGYAAPEQYETLSVDERSDIYSIGTLLYFLVTGCGYKNGNSLKTELPASISRELENLIRTCIQYSPSGRYQTINQLKDQLTQLKNSGIKKQHGSTSLSIAVAGTQNRMGTTHIALMLTAYFHSEGKHFIYKRVLDSEKVEKEERTGVVLDFGVLNQKNKTAFAKADIRLLAAGAKEWEWPDTYRCLNDLWNDKEVYYLFNFVDSVSFRQVKKTMGNRKAIEVPYCPDPSRLNGMACGKAFIEEIRKGRMDQYHKLKRMTFQYSRKKKKTEQVTIGLCGTHTGAGVTHFGIALAWYTAVRRKQKTAYIEMSGKQDFYFIQKELKESFGEPACFFYQGIYFFTHTDAKMLEEIQREDYSYIILDFGTGLRKQKEEYMRCMKKYVLCSLTSWKLPYLEEFVAAWDRNGDQGFRYLSMLGQLGKESLVIGGKKFHTIGMGYIPDPFMVSKIHEKMLQSILLKE